MDFASKYSLSVLSNLSHDLGSQCSIKLAQCTSLDGMITNRDDTVDVDVLCTPSEKGSVICSFHIQGALQVECQRCMEPMEIPVDVRMRWVLSETAHGQTGHGREGVEIMAFSEYPGMDGLIGQELLLRLPMVAMHEKEHCPARHLVVSGNKEDDGHQKPRINSAFDVLQTLKRQR